MLAQPRHAGVRRGRHERDGAHQLRAGSSEPGGCERTERVADEVEPRQLEMVQPGSEVAGLGIGAHAATQAGAATGARRIDDHDVPIRREDVEHPAVCLPGHRQPGHEHERDARGGDIGVTLHPGGPQPTDALASVLDRGRWLSHARECGTTAEGERP